jgi:hypothetical protein
MKVNHGPTNKGVGLDGSALFFFVFFFNFFLSYFKAMEYLCGKKFGMMASGKQQERHPQLVD